MAELVSTKTINGVTWYYCHICQCWDKGTIINVTGYSELVCTGCDLTFDDDISGQFEYEKNGRSNE